MSNPASGPRRPVSSKLAALARPGWIRRRVRRLVAMVGLLPIYWRLRAGSRRLASALRPRRIAATFRWAWTLATQVRRRRAEELLTVAVDISPLWEPLTGIGRYLYRLIEHLASRDDVKLRLYGPVLADKGDNGPAPVVELPSGPALEVVRYAVPADLSLSRERLWLWLRRLEPVLIALDGNAILFAPNYFLPSWFRRARGRLVMTVHDLSVRRVPWTMREATRRDLERELERSLGRAERVLTDSEAVRSELVAEGLVAADRVHSVHLGPGLIETSDGCLPSAVPARYVLFVGTLEPRKGLSTLFAAWRRLRRQIAPPPLVLCGAFGWKSADLRAEVDKAVAEGWLVHFGYVEDAVLAALYRQASFVALPSVYEGFGLPAVEAMHAGSPLVLSDLPVLREIGGDAALYAAAEDPVSWAEQAARLLGDVGLRDELVRRGRERRRRFDWRRTATETLDVWREVG